MTDENERQAVQTEINSWHERYKEKVEDHLAKGASANDAEQRAAMEIGREIQRASTTAKPFRDPKFKIGELVYKHTGDYGGPGRVRGICVLENGKLRYLVGHRIEGGSGEFLHIYAEGNLREVDGGNGEA